MSDVFVNSLFTFLGVVFTGLMAYQTLKLNKVGKVTDAVHILVNSAMSAQLKISMVALKRIAALSSATREDKDAAIEAENLWKEHQKQQKVVDRGKFL